MPSPGKENAGASQVFVGQRDGDGTKYNLGIRGRLGGEVISQGQAAVPVDDRKVRVKFRQWRFVFVARNLDLRNHRERFYGDQLLNSIGCHKPAIRGLGSRLIQAIGDSAK